MTDYDLQKVKDEYDLNALVGKFLNSNKVVSMDAKDAIKNICRECFILGQKTMEKRIQNV